MAKDEPSPPRRVACISIDLANIRAIVRQFNRRVAGACICRYIRCKWPAATSTRSVALCANASFIGSECQSCAGSPELEYTARAEWRPRWTDSLADVSCRYCDCRDG